MTAYTRRQRPTRGLFVYERDLNVTFSSTHACGEPVAFRDAPWGTQSEMGQRMDAERRIKTHLHALFNLAFKTGICLTQLVGLCPELCNLQLL